MRGRRGRAPQPQMGLGAIGEAQVSRNHHHTTEDGKADGDAHRSARQPDLPDHHGSELSDHRGERRGLIRNKRGFSSDR